nr:MAG TPA: replisome organizer [Caudoviricetes sp.]
MPNRIIKETIRTSKKLNSLTDFQFRLWVYLITYVDDYGRGSADPEIIKGFVFPRRKKVNETDIKDALAALASTGCISLYDKDGESYFCFPSWGEHQRIQTKRSKFPEPPILPESHLFAVEDDALQKATVDHREKPPESESESKSEDTLSSTPKAGAEPCDVSTLAADATAIKLPLNDNTEYAVSRSFASEMAELYPAVDVMQQLAAMRGWLIGNPTKRKTRAGIKRFITSWLAREQDRGRPAAQRQQYAPTPSKTALTGDASYDLEAFERMTLYGTGGGRG